MDLTDRVSIVTGSGSGIGRAIARDLARQGSRVVCADIDDDGNEETLSMIEADGGDAIAVRTDISDQESVADLVSRATSEYGQIDILVNNAGISPPNYDEIEDKAVDDWDRIQDVNLKGAFLMTKHVVPHLKTSENGVVVNVGSTAALSPRHGSSAYSASKGGVVALTRQQATELAEYGIRVNVVCPVATDTPLFHHQRSEEDTRAVIETIPLGRLVEPEEIAYAVSFLVSDRSRMITGVTLPVDGGRTI